MKCFAKVNRVKSRWSMQRINFYETHPCMFTESDEGVLVDKDGNRRPFCTQHRKMALRGLVRTDGTTPEPAQRADIRRIERRDKHRYDWGAAGWTKGGTDGLD